MQEPQILFINRRSRRTELWRRLHLPAIQIISLALTASVHLAFV